MSQTEPVDQRNQRSPAVIADDADTEREVALKLSPNLCRLVLTLSFLGIALTLLPACSTGSQMRGQAEEISNLNSAVEDRAYRCAPREIATAQAHVEFGISELDRGNFVRAGQHLEVAERNARIAHVLSDYEECERRDRDMDVGIAEAERADIDPVDFMWDSDGDGIPDHESECPYEPIVFIGDPEQERTGCPNYDVDGDGVPNTEDHCPGIAADIDGFPGENGCPMLDMDGDGVLNVNSQCPYEPVEFIGYREATGCPNYDVDDDGIPNVLDECPFEPGPAENAGCPVEEEALAEIQDDRIELHQKVYFETAEAEILPQSFPLLNQVAQILENNPSITIRIEGHTDSRGGWDYNKRLSENRAGSVREYLIERGIESHRLESEGFSYDRPIDDNATADGRAANRRVEVHITSR